MHVVRFAVVMGLVFTPVAWAGSQAAAPPGAAGAGSLHPANSRQLSRSQVEVDRLQRDLHRQESDNRHAGERLQQQDQKITELRRQLQELQAGQPAARH